MRVLVCVKRVPAVGAHISVTEDARRVDTRYLGFTISPHEECAVEEAVRLVEKHGGDSVVLSLGTAEAIEQLRDALALGVSRALHLLADGDLWGPQATAAAITTAVRAEEAEHGSFDLLLFGNEAADTGDYQVPIRVAHALGRPVVSGVKTLAISDGMGYASREYAGSTEAFTLPLPAVVSVREGINLPRYPSLPGRLRAKKAIVSTVTPVGVDDGLVLTRLCAPAGVSCETKVLGRGAEAAPAVVELFQRLGLVGS